MVISIRLAGLAAAGVAPAAIDHAAGADLFRGGGCLCPLTKPGKCKIPRPSKTQRPEKIPPADRSLLPLALLQRRGLRELCFHARDRHRLLAFGDDGLAHLVGIDIDELEHMVVAVRAPAGRERG